MFDIIAKKLIEQNLAKVNDNKITIDIPRSHPKLEQFLKLVNGLASIQHMSSGIVIHKAEKIGAVDEVLDALRSLDIDVDSLVADLNATSRVDFTKTFENMSKSLKSGNIPI